MTHRTRVKICGITRPQDALLSEQLGADALGFVFVPASKRYIEPEQARTISDQVAPFIVRVGLFLDAPKHEVDNALKIMPGLLPQFHGRETPAECEQFGVPYLKAIGLGGRLQSTDSTKTLTEALAEEMAAYKNAQGFLFDSNEPGQLGGTGHAFNWQQLDSNIAKPFILAGGLNASNVQSAIQQMQPYSVDVSSGVESDKGIKDHDALRAFMRSVHTANLANHNS